MVYQSQVYDIENLLLRDLLLLSITSMQPIAYGNYMSNVVVLGLDSESEPQTVR